MTTVRAISAGCRLDQVRTTLVWRGVLLGVLTAYAVGYELQFDAGPQRTAAFAPLYTAGGLWAAIHGVLFAVGRRVRRACAWTTILGVGADLAVVAVLHWGSRNIAEMDFARNALFTLYCLPIALAAVHRDPRLALGAGIASAALYLAISLHLGFPHVFPKSILLWNGIQVATVELTDTVTHALALLVIGLMVGYVTRRTQMAGTVAQQLFETIPHPVAMVAADGTPLLANSAYGAMAGDRPAATTAALVRAEDTTTTIPVRGGRMRASVSRRSVPDRDAGSGYLLSIRDTAESESLRRRTEEARQNEALAQLARGLAHDFNNLLGGILGAVALMERRIGSLDGAMRGRLEQCTAMIRSNADAARDILRRLLALSRDTARTDTLVDLRSLLDEVVRVWRRTIHFDRDIAVHIHAQGACYAIGNETALFHALYNLCLNAQDATGAGDTIDIALAPCNAPPTDALAFSATTSTWWEIRISDSGEGMAPEVLQRAFEPFFSTRGDVARPGLGLTIARAIVRDHRGHLYVDSAQGKGTRVSVVLPSAEAHRER